MKNSNFLSGVNIISKVKCNFVVILPDGSESYHEVWDYGNDRSDKYQKAAEEAVRLSGITKPRDEPFLKILVSVYSLVIKKGKVNRECKVDVEVSPPFAVMTDDDFNREMTEIMAGIPPEFVEFITTKSYDDGHSAGHEEVISLARGMAGNLKKAVEKYNKRLQIG